MPRTDILGLSPLFNGMYGFEVCEICVPEGDYKQYLIEAFASGVKSCEIFSDWAVKNLQELRELLLAALRVRWPPAELVIIDISRTLTRDLLRNYPAMKEEVYRFLDLAFNCCVEQGGAKIVLFSNYRFEHPLERLIEWSHLLVRMRPSETPPYWESQIVHPNEWRGRKITFDPTDAGEGEGAPPQPAPRKIRTEEIPTMLLHVLRWFRSRIRGIPLQALMKLVRFLHVHDYRKAHPILIFWHVYYFLESVRRGNIPIHAFVDYLHFQGFNDLQPHCRRQALQEITRAFGAPCTVKESVKQYFREFYGRFWHRLSPTFRKVGEALIDLIPDRDWSGNARDLAAAFIYYLERWEVCRGINFIHLEVIAEDIASSYDEAYYLYKKFAWEYLTPYIRNLTLEQFLRHEQRELLREIFLDWKRFHHDLDLGLWSRHPSSLGRFIEFLNKYKGHVQLHIPYTAKGRMGTMRVLLVDDEGTCPDCGGRACNDMTYPISNYYCKECSKLVMRWE